MKNTTGPVITRDGWVLQDANGLPVHEGESIFTRTGDARHAITGGCPPKHEGSSGRVYCGPSREFFPHVFDLKWVKLDENI